METSRQNKWLLLSIGIVSLVILVTFVTIALLPNQYNIVIIINKHESCIDRCGAEYDPTQICQCNTECHQNLDCCRDYMRCDGTGGDSTTSGGDSTTSGGDSTTKAPGSITDAEIAALSQQIWDADVDKVTVSLNPQNQTTVGSKVDKAPKPLFNEIPPEFTSSPIYIKLIALFDNYHADDSISEEITESQWTEVDDFLTEAMKSRALQLTHELLASKNLVPSDASAFQAELRKIWYHLYDRSGSLTSCGGEHVQVGETRNKGMLVIGLHNWVRFALLEPSGKINYLGYVDFMDFGETYAISNPFFWDKYYKPIGGFFIGTSPVFDLSVYTLCFYARPNSKESCTLNINGKDIKVQTHTMEYNGETLVGSSYPVLFQRELIV